MKKVTLSSVITAAGLLLYNSSSLVVQDELPYFLKDRGTSIATSMFGTHINKGEFSLYAYYEHYYDQNTEYKPAELGFGVDQDFPGRYRVQEGSIFIGYGISDRLASEFEPAVITAQLLKSKDDQSNMPDKLKESGLGDVETQLRCRWSKQPVSRSEYSGYSGTVFPLQKDKKSIQTQDWENKLATGLIKGFGWGTVTLGSAIEYSAAEIELDLGEYAIEYSNRVSNLLRFCTGTEETQVEVEPLTDLQFHIHPDSLIRINNAFGVTSKATDYAPEVGILFHL